MDYSKETNYMKGFLPYALAAFLVGIVGGLSTVLGPAFMQDMNLAYNNTTWSALAQAISTDACAPTVMSYIVTEFPPKQIAKGFSLYMLLSSVAVIFGPTLGGLILEHGNWRTLMWTSSIICVVFLSLCFFTLPQESYTHRGIYGSKSLHPACYYFF